MNICKKKCLVNLLQTNFYSRRLDLALYHYKLFCCNSFHPPVFKCKKQQKDWFVRRIMCDDKISWFTNKTKIVLNKMTLKVTINQVVYLKSY